MRALRFSDATLPGLQLSQTVQEGHRDDRPRRPRSGRRPPALAEHFDNEWLFRRFPSFYLQLHRSSAKFFCTLSARPLGTSVTSRHSGHSSRLKPPSATSGRNKRA